MSALDVEVATLKEHLAALRRQHTRLSDTTADVISSFAEASRRAQRQGQQSADTAVRLAEAAVLIPLAVRDQRVELSRSGATQRVQATVLCADPSDVVTLRLELESVRVGAATEDLDAATSNHEARADVRIVQLIAGEPSFLLESAVDERVVFKVRRVGGELCLLRLEISPERSDKTPFPAANASTSPLFVSKRHKRPSPKGTLWKAMQLLRAGRPDLAMDVALGQASDIERPALSLLHATLAAHDEVLWLSHLNKYVEQFDIAPIRLRTGPESKFLRLDAQRVRSVTHGPIVTVIMPAFNAERTLEFAATSILKQSWQPLELILIDDCSTDETWQIAKRLESRDSRVRAYRNSANVGPYVSKNRVLSTASGAYITCHDADDWAHPQRIEGQVEAMRRNGSHASACIGRWLRLDDSGVLTGFTRVGRQSDDGALQLAHVTCMLEADFMRRYIGHWDCVRFGADGEMLERLERILGSNLLRPRQLCVLSLNAQTSLTNDPVHGISRTTGLSPTRRAYRDSWRQWHATLRMDTACIEFPQTSRPFPAPDVCLVPNEAVEPLFTDAVSPQQEPRSYIQPRSPDRCDNNLMIRGLTNEH